MKKMIALICLAGILSMTACFDFHSGTDPDDQDFENQEVTRTYEAKDFVSITTVSGDCRVLVGDDDVIVVEFVHDHNPTVIDAEFEERENTLYLREEFHGSSSGSSLWTVTVPAETRIQFSSASGDLDVNGLASELRATTASGDIDVTDGEGIFRIVSASGDVRMQSSTQNDVENDVQVETAS